MNIEFLRKARLTLDSYIIYYSRSDRDPNWMNALGLIPYFVAKRLSGLRLLHRFIESASYKSSFNPNEERLPEIELLLVSTRKDSETVPQVIEYAIKHSRNKVTRISIIVPENQVPFFSSLIEKEEYSGLVEIISEDVQLKSSDRQLIKDIMGNRYGWTLQQFLTVSFCLESSARGVLAVNSDTVILQDQTWLDSKGKQILMESFEFNPDYYDLIKKVNPKFDNLNSSHITHHMLFQPELLKSCLRYFGVDDLSSFIRLLLKHVNPESASPICAEFEPYAQFLRKTSSDRVEMIKFSNIGIQRPRDIALVDLIQKYENQKNYNSISFHSWMA